jgi:hypothetical protein
MWILLALATVWPASVAAYPQWQFSSGTARCRQCHLAPGGGGPLTAYARDAVGEELSTVRGNGAFLHGALTLPSRLTLGGDLRGAVVGRDVQDPAGSTLAAFPMQAELHAWVRLWKGFSVYGTGGLRGQVRDDDEVVPTQNYHPISTSRLISREHYVIWQPAAQGPYARAGRFFAPFGLRFAEHVTYVRRDLGFNVLEESYNVSGGHLADAWELHLTAFAPDVFREMGGREVGAAAYFEHRIFDDGALGAQAKVGFSDGRDRVLAGGVGKYHLPLLRTQLFAEANLVRQTFDADDAGARHQLVGAAGVAVLPVRGVMVTLLAERNQVDLMVRDAAWTAATGLVNWFPYPHVELQLAGQVQFPAGGVAAKTVLLQLHYFL